MNRHQKNARRAGERKVGGDEVPVLIELSRSADPEDRLIAAGGLCPCHVRKRIPEAWDSLYRMMEDPDARVRRAAWHTLEDGGQPDDPALDSILDRALKTETDPVVLNFARVVLGRRKKSAVAPPVQWKAMRRAQCDFCGKPDTLVDFDLKTMIPSVSGARQALVCKACAAVS